MLEHHDGGAISALGHINQSLSRILSKLDDVRRRGLKCFGSQAHAFRLNPPIAEAEVHRFEHRHGISLPDDYRAFLIQAGNGGAGPYYGLLPLDNWNDAARDAIGGLPGSPVSAPARHAKGRSMGGRNGLGPG